MDVSRQVVSPYELKINLANKCLSTQTTSTASDTAAGSKQTHICLNVKTSGDAHIDGVNFYVQGFLYVQGDQVCSIERRLDMPTTWFNCQEGHHAAIAGIDFTTLQYAYANSDYRVPTMAVGKVTNDQLSVVQ
jgi:hypothetical protein